MTTLATAGVVLPLAQGVLPGYDVGGCMENTVDSLAMVGLYTCVCWNYKRIMLSDRAWKQIQVESS